MPVVVKSPSHQRLLPIVNEHLKKTIENCHGQQELWYKGRSKIVVKLSPAAASVQFERVVLSSTELDVRTEPEVVQAGS